MSKSEMITAIEYFFEKQGKRMTNLNRVNKSKLESIISKFNINLKKEIDELTEIKKQKHILKQQEEEEKEKIRLKEDKIHERNFNAKWLKPHIKKVKEMLEEEQNNQIQIAMKIEELKLQSKGIPYIRNDDHFIVRGIHVYVGCSCYYYDLRKWILLPKFKIENGKLVPVL